MNTQRSWWHSLEKVAKAKANLAWIVLLALPALAVSLELRQKVLEKRRDTQEAIDREKREREHAAEKEKLEKERKELKSQVERHENQFGPRSISPEQRQKFLAKTAGAPKGSVSISIVWSDEEAQIYSAQLKDTLSAAGFTVVGSGVWGLGSPSGLWLSLNNLTNAPAHAATLFAGLKDAGIQVELKVEPKQSEDAVLLYLGSKPMPQRQR